MPIDPVFPIGPRPDLGPVERVQLTVAERDAERRDREERRRRRRRRTPEEPPEEDHGGIDIRV
jgi:hypothetical protein